MPTSCSNVLAKFALIDINRGTLYFNTNSVAFMGFNMTLGIGDDSCTLNLEITADPNCPSDAAPNTPELGVPVLFKSLTNEFYFGGIVNNITYYESSTGFKWSVRIKDPKQLLDNVTVVLKNYYCQIKDCNGVEAKNFINAAYIMEGAAVANCPPGEDYENFPNLKNCDKFGSSGLGVYGPRVGGVSLRKLFDALQAKGVEVYTTNPANDRKLKLDFSELIKMLKTRGEFAKTINDNDTLSSLISQAADACSCDYFTTIEPAGTIKVWLIDRTVPPPIGVIQNLINEKKLVTKNITQNNVGQQEVYATSHKVIVGDQIHYLKEIDAGLSGDDAIMMFFGYEEPTLDNPLKPILVTPRNFQQNGVEINVGPLIEIFAKRNKFFPAIVALTKKIRVTEQEMLMAKEQNLWLLYGLSDRMRNNRPGLASIICDVIGIKADINLPDVIAAIDAIYDKGPAADPTKTREEYWKEQHKKLLLINGNVAKKESFILFEMAWNWFNELINTYYGKKYFIPVIGNGKSCICPNENNPAVQAEIPNIRWLKKSDGKLFELSDVPVEAGYPSKNQLQNGILGLNYPFDLYAFQTDDTRVNGFVMVSLGQTRNIKFAENVPYSVALQDMEPSSYFSKNLRMNNLDKATGYIYIKFSTDGEVYVSDKQITYVSITLATAINLAPDFCIGLDPDDCADQFLTIGIRSMAAIFGKDKFENKANKDGYANISEFNVYSLRSAAGAFRAICLPLKSMYYTYGRNKNFCKGIDGPFIGSKGVVGKTDFIIDSHLNPWEYGGYIPMEIFGEQLALVGIRNHNLEESGEMTAAEAPTNSISYYIQRYKLLLNNINVNYGAGGATTTYSFTSKVPKFANYANEIADQLKRNKSAMNDVISSLYNARKKLSTDINLLYKNIFAEKAKELNPWSSEKTPVGLITGGYFDIKNPNINYGGNVSPQPNQMKDSYGCGEYCNPTPPSSPNPSTDGDGSLTRSFDVGIDKLVNGSLQIAFTGDAYKTQVIMSMDGILAPVSLNGRVGNDGRHRASRYYTSWNNYSQLVKPRPPCPPLGKNEQIPINQKYMNPILNREILTSWDDRKGETDKAANIQVLSYEDDPKYIYNEDKRESATDFGFFSLRGPLVLQAWGYDTNGKPIPNSVDSPDAAEKGVFQSAGLKNKFMKNWIRNPMTWPVGPIDLRFDRDRGVWVSPAQSERILVAELAANLNPYGCADAILLNPYACAATYFDNYSVWGKEGENLFADLSSIRVRVYDFLGRSLCARTRVYIVNVDGKYIVLESSAAKEENCSECSCTESTTTTTTTTTETTETTTACVDACGLKECLSEASYYNGGIQQVLGHDGGGCLRWYDLTNCESTTAPP